MPQNTESLAIPDGAAPKKHTMLTRFIGAVTGLAGGFSIAKMGRSYSLQHYVKGQLEAGHAEMLRVQDGITGKIAGGSGIYAKADFYEDAMRDTIQAIEGIYRKTEEALKNAATQEAKDAVRQDRVFKVGRATEKFLDKPVYKEIIKRLELGMKQSEHKAAIYGFGVVSAVTIGFAAYYAAKKIFENPKPVATHQERIAQSTSDNQAMARP